MKITQPEDLTPDELTLIPNPPTERTATALLPLLEGVSEVMKIPAEELVQLQGGQFEHGSAGMFGRLEAPGSMQYVGMIVGWFKAGKGGGFSAIEFASEDEAARQYEAVVGKLG